jgi:spermidine synthase
MKSLNHILLPFAVFITGASILILEVVGVRLLSPFYGNTIFTVSSVISVILFALSVGYYAGGVLADRHPSLEWFFGIVLASGVVLLLFYLIGALVLPPLSRVLSIETGPLVSSALLFLLPALSLGTLSPYAVRLQSELLPHQGVGRIAGRIFFWSTLGSITGSLLAGFVLVPNFGINAILIANGIVLSALGVTALALLRVKKSAVAVAVALVVLLAGAAASVDLGAASGETILYRRDGVYQKITIYEGQYYGRPARFFLLDRSESGAMFLDSTDPSDLVYDYTKYYRLYKIFTPRARRALVLGGGAYSIPKAMLREMPDVDIDVAEIEPGLFDLARRYFRAADDPRLHNHVEDGRRFLADTARQYDLIFGDVYFSYFSVPPHFTTREFFTLAKNHLAPGGLFVANMIGDLSRRQPSLIMAEIRTFQSVFPNSYFLAVDSPAITDLVQNITLAGYNDDRRVDLHAPSLAGFPDPLIRALPYKLIDVDRRYELSAYPVLTDDFSPVEYLTARALQRSLGGPGGVDGAEIRAVVDQQLRYRDDSGRTGGHHGVRDFLRAEMQALAQSVEIQSWTPDGNNGDEHMNIIGRFSTADDRRVVVATRYDSSPGTVAVLIETARSLINSPLPLKVGVDIVFLDGAEGNAHLQEWYAASPPISTTILDKACGEAAESTCTANALQTTAASLLNSLHAMQ